MSEELLEKEVSSWDNYNPGSHENIKKIIKDNINSVCANYVAIGYYLNVVNDRKLYEDDGYSGIGEYAAAEYGIQKDKCSYLMKIANKFCMPSSPALLPEYRNFTVSKLREMIYLTDEQLEQVTITTTVAEIRDIKKPEPEKVATSQLEPEPKINPNSKHILDQLMSEYYCALPVWRRFLEEDMQKYGNNEAVESFFQYHAGQGQDIKADNKGPGYGFTFYTAGKGTTNIELWYANQRVRLSPDEFMILFLKHQPKIMEDEPENVDNEPEIVNDVDKPEISEPERMDCDNCEKHHVLGDTEYCEVNSKDIGCHDYEPIEPDQVETVEADIIETLSIETKSPDIHIPCHLELAKEMLKQKQERLNDFIRVQADTYADRKYIESRKVEVAALAAYITDIDNIVNPIPKPVQPELPIMKNNEQRKEWAENYKAWGEWYYDQNIDCYYYKYDFPNGDRLVVEEYQGLIRYWNRNEKYDQANYHLCIKQKTDQWTKKPYEQRYEHSTTSITEIVDYLKDIQKKGA